MCLYVYTWLSKSYISDYLIYFLFLPCVHVNSKDSCFRPLFSFRLIRTDCTHQKGTDLEMYKGSVSPAQHASCMNLSLSAVFSIKITSEELFYWCVIWMNQLFELTRLHEAFFFFGSCIQYYYWIIHLPESVFYFQCVCVWRECITGRSCRNVYSVCQCTFVEPCLFRLTVTEIHLIHW